MKTIKKTLKMFRRQWPRTAAVLTTLLICLSGGMLLAGNIDEWMTFSGPSQIHLTAPEVQVGMQIDRDQTWRAMTNQDVSCYLVCGDISGFTPQSAPWKLYFTASTNRTGLGTNYGYIGNLDFSRLATNDLPATEVKFAVSRSLWLSVCDAEGQCYVHFVRAPSKDYDDRDITIARIAFLARVNTP